MPFLIHPATIFEFGPLNRNSANSCNYSDPSQNQMQQTQIDSNEIMDCVNRFRTFMEQRLPASEEANMVYYSAFKISDILNMIAQNLDCNFLRVYSGMDESGKQFKVLLPIKPSGVVKTEENAVYLMDCCQCRPDCN